MQQSAPTTQTGPATLVNGGQTYRKVGKSLIINNSLNEFLGYKDSGFKFQKGQDSGFRFQNGSDSGFRFQRFDPRALVIFGIQDSYFKTKPKFR